MRDSVAIYPPEPPSRYALGADEPCVRLASDQWNASRSQAQEPHQQVLPLPTYLLLPEDRLIKLSRGGRPETRMPACAARLCHPGRFTLYPCHYNTAFACSLIPSTLSYRLALRSASPRYVGGQRRYFVHLLNHRGRVVPICRQRVIRDRGTLKLLFLAAYLLVQACQHLMRPCWLVEHHGLYQHLL